MQRKGLGLCLGLRLGLVQAQVRGLLMVGPLLLMVGPLPPVQTHANSVYFNATISMIITASQVRFLHREHAVPPI